MRCASFLMSSNASRVAGALVELTTPSYSDCSNFKCFPLSPLMFSHDDAVEAVPLSPPSPSFLHSAADSRVSDPTPFTAPAFIDPLSPSSIIASKADDSSLHSPHKATVRSAAAVRSVAPSTPSSHSVVSGTGSPSSRSAASSPRRGPSLSFSIPIAAPIAVPVPFIATPSSHSHPHPPPQPQSSSSIPAPSLSHPPPPPPRPSLIHSPAYTEFKANVPLTRLPLTSSISWSYYSMGPSSFPPLICLHGASTTPSSFYSQMLCLTSRGYRVISASWPPYWTVKAWSDGFRDFLNALHIDEAHLLGFGLGGMLALQFAVDHSDRVSSLVLCNGYMDTTAFAGTALWCGSLYWMPEFAVKAVMLQGLPQSTLSPEAVDFVVEEMSSLNAGEVASRLTLVHTPHTVDRLAVIDQSRVTLIFPTEDVQLLPDISRDRLLSALPQAKVAWLKEGGDFPHLSTPDQVNLHLITHLRRVACPTSTGEEEHKSKTGTERVKEPPSISSVQPSPPPSSSQLSRHPHLSAPLFKPAHSVLDGGPSTVAGYEAQAEAVDEAAVQEQIQHHAEMKLEEEKRREKEAMANEAEERRCESLRLQSEVEVRLNAQRAAREAERQETQRRVQERTSHVMAGLMDEGHGGPQPTLRGSDSGIFE